MELTLEEYEDNFQATEILILNYMDADPKSTEECKFSEI